MTELPRLLTQEEWTILTHPTRVELSYKSRSGRQWEDRPFMIEIDARPLANLAESAAVGHRLYEFMHLRRPGDLLRYWWVTTADVGPELVAHVNRRLTVVDRNIFATNKPPLAVPFTTFDATFWQQETGYVDEDADNVARTWIEYRRRNPRPAQLDAMFGIVRAAQAQLRSSPDPLLRHELALIELLTHVRDYWAYPALATFRSSVPRAEPTLDVDLLELIGSLARRADVRSVSCPFDDRTLWRALVWEQLERAKIQGLPPNEALFLAGPDSGLKYVEAEDWGGNIHIPYEGACAADVFVKPHWHAFDRDGALSEGSVRGGLFGKAHRYALVQGDLGEFPRDERVRCGDWTLYRFQALSPRFA